MKIAITGIRGIPANYGGFEIFCGRTLGIYESVFEPKQAKGWFPIGLISRKADI